MDFDIGIACGGCDTFSPMGTSACPACGEDLSVNPAAYEGARPETEKFAKVKSAADPLARPVDLTQLSKEELMELARNYVCRECSMGVPSGHKFCGTCGAAVPPEIAEMQTEYFGSLQEPGKARLTLIRGDSDVEGLSYVLQGTEHVAGRAEGQILFPDDPLLSPRHANFVYQGDKLLVRDEGSVNGIYLRVRGEAPLEFGDTFLCGEQVFKLEAPPPDDAGPDSDQTYFYSSPRRTCPFRLVQVLRGGISCGVFPARSKVMTIGREDCDVSFPGDVYMSGTHAKVEMGGKGSFTLADTGSRNGTYLRIRQAQVLQHGDYVFLGKQLLRVEMTS